MCRKPKRLVLSLVILSSYVSNKNIVCFYRGSPGCVGEQGNMIIYFNGTRDIFGINTREQGISLLLEGTLTNLLGKDGVF